MSLVLDSSATLARIFPSERTPAILRLFRDRVVLGAWVPALWKIEVANALSIGIRRGRITSVRRDRILVLFQKLPIECDEQTVLHAWSATLKLADTHKLTVYDATYLELALRRSLPLATLDRELRLAAQAEGVTLLGQ